MSDQEMCGAIFPKIAPQQVGDDHVYHFGPCWPEVIVI